MGDGVVGNAVLGCGMFWNDQEGWEGGFVGGGGGGFAELVDLMDGG